MKFGGDTEEAAKYASHPARGAWIEIKQVDRVRDLLYVAPRKGCVD